MINKDKSKVEIQSNILLAFNNIDSHNFNWRLLLH
jgi:hypothetical protein